MARCECPHEDCGAMFESDHRPSEMTCCSECGRQQAPRPVAVTLPDVLAAVERHHKEHTDHGINCACMDRHIQQVRKLFMAKNPDAQRRVDNVLALALRR